MDDEHDEVESRFAHLLQPLRNLADNWNIDIASELEEYLHELESITFSFDGIGKSLNFAEAALLIQGSTIIYSKKVEYLYTLLYQTLEFLIEKKKKNQKKDNNDGALEDGAAADDDDPENDFREQEAEFLTLDDLQEAENIDLDESGDTNRLRISLTRGSTPLALMSLNAEDNTSDGTKKTDFRMNTCAVHSSGALLLEDERRLRDDTFKAPAPPDHSHRSMSLGGDRLLDANPTLGNLDRSLDSSDDEDNEDIDSEGKDKDKSKDGESDKEKDKDGVEKEKKGEEEEDEAAKLKKQREEEEKEEEEERNRLGGLEVRPGGDQQDKSKSDETAKGDQQQVDATLGNAATRATRGKRGAAEGTTEEDENAIRERLFNLWATMDPHSNQGVRPAPFKKGKTYRVPASLAAEAQTTKGKTNAKGKDTTKKEDEDGEATLKKGDANAHGSLFKVKGPYLPEFNYLYLKEMKRRVKERKQGKDLRAGKRKGAANAPVGVVMDDLSTEELGVEYVEEPAVLDAIEALAANATELEPSHIQAAIASTSGLPMPGMEGEEGDLSSDEDDMGWNAEPMAFDEQAVHRHAADGQLGPDALPQLEEGQIIQSYEDLCRKHIDTYLSSAKAFAVETALTLRVADWRAKLEPILSRQEEAKPFDIHSYGESVITRFRAPEKQRPVSTFETLVEGEEGTSEICRLFAATLQLANHGNVEIIPEHEYGADIEDEDERMHIKGSFSLKLLSSTLVTFETNNNINIAVLKKKPGEGDESEEHHLSQQEGGSTTTTTSTKSKKTTAQKRKRNDKTKAKKNKASEDEEEEAEEEEEEEAVMSTEEDDGRTQKGRKGAAKQDEEDGSLDEGEVSLMDEEEEEEEDDGEEENRAVSKNNKQKKKKTTTAKKKPTSKAARGRGARSRGATTTTGRGRRK